jgi:thiamine pyrophosphokinase
VTGSGSHVVIVGGGDVDDAELAHLTVAAAVPDVAVAPSPLASEERAHPLVLAADGGAAHCRAAGIQPDLVIGDLDSLAPEEHTRLAGLGVEIRVSDRAKDESDLELCVAAALDLGASRITILGGLGVERPEHSIANLLLLADPRLDGRDVTLVGHGAGIVRIGTSSGPGRTSIEGAPGDFVSLLPIGGDVEGVTTTGLRFPLHDETLPVGPSRGLSNEVTGAQATVTTRRGRLLVVHTSPSIDQPYRR